MNALIETDFILSEHFIPGCLYGYCIYFTAEMGMTDEVCDGNGRTDDVMCMMLYHDGNGQGRRRDVYDAVSRRKRTGQAT